jgi:hypothetical protein
MVAEANVSVLLIRSQKLVPFASDLTDLPADDLPREDGLPSFFLEVVSMSPFICADANVSVYAILAKKALEVFVVLGADADLDLAGWAAIFPFICAEAYVSVLASLSNILGDTRCDEEDVDGWMDRAATLALEGLLDERMAYPEKAGNADFPLGLLCRLPADDWVSVTDSRSKTEYPFW